MDPIDDFIVQQTVVAVDVKKKMEGDLELDLNTYLPDEATRQAELLASEETVCLVYKESEVNTKEVVISQVPPTVIFHEESVSTTISPAETTPPTIMTTSSESSVKIKWREVESVSAPPIDIIEHEDSYHIFAEVPGLSTKDISIDLSNNMFTLTGDKRDHPLFSSSPVKAGDVVVRQEINKKGRFKRVLELPENVDASDVNVRYEEGMLQFKIRKIVIEDKPEKIVEEKQEEKVVEKEEKAVEEKQEDQNKPELEVSTDGDKKEGAEETAVGDDGTTAVEKQKRSAKNSKLGKKRASCLLQ